VGFTLLDEWKVTGVLGDQMALFYADSAVGQSGKQVLLEAVPQSEDNLDLFITAVDIEADADKLCYNHEEDFNQGVEITHCCFIESGVEVRLKEHVTRG